MINLFALLKVDRGVQVNSQEFLSLIKERKEITELCFRMVMVKLVRSIQTLEMF